MYDLSLHLLDIIENSIRAGAGVVLVTVEEDLARNTLLLSVEDNGPGIHVPLDVATDPFYTTKPKRTGFGLGWMRSTAEQAGGSLVICRSALGGAKVIAEMRLRHINRLPMGDLASTISGVVCTNPEIDIQFRIVVNGREQIVRSSDVRSERSEAYQSEFEIGQKVRDRINGAIGTLKPVYV